MGTSTFFKTIAQAMAAIDIFAGFGLSVVGVAIMIQFGLNVIAADFGQSAGAIVFLLGVYFLVSGLMIYLAISDAARVDEGFWTGKRVLFVTLIPVCGICVYCIIVFQRANDLFTELGSVLSDLQSASTDDAVPIVSSENTVANYFNYFYYEAVNDCTKSADWFWLWVDQYCPSRMHKQLCMRCPSYSLTFCPLDLSECTASEDPLNEYCAYSNCRYPVLHFFYDSMLRTTVALSSVFFLFHVVLILSSFILLCIRVKDKQRVIVIEIDKPPPEPTAEDQQVAAALRASLQRPPVLDIPIQPYSSPEGGHVDQRPYSLRQAAQQREEQEMQYALALSVQGQEQKL